MAMSPMLSEVEGPPVSYPKSIFSMLAEQLRKNSQNIALISTHQPAEYLSEFTGRTEDSSSYSNGTTPNYLRWTYQDIHNASLRIVANLRAQGIGPGSTVVTIMPNGIEWLVLYWSSFLGKFTLCPLDFGVVNEYRSVELTDLLTITNADAVFVADVEGAVAVDKALLSVTRPVSCKVVVATPSDLPSGWKLLMTYRSDPTSEVKQKIEEEAEEDDLDRPVFIIFTSGTTTGRPKGCARTVMNVLHGVICQPFGYDLGSSTRHLFQTQNFRVIASVVILGTWRLGGGLVMPGAGFSPDSMLDAITAHKVTFMIIVPAMVHMIRAHLAFQTTELSSVKLVMIGADIITRDVYEKVADAFPSADVSIGHGMTEGGGAVIWPFYGDSRRPAQDLPWYANIGTLGQVGQGTKIRIADGGDKPVRRGESGELQICNPGFVRQYLGGVQPQDFYQDKQGSWFRTGDIARLDKDGFIFLLGRRKDIVKRAGVSIMPAGLESCIDEYLKTQTSIVAVSHPILGQVPFAVVQSLNGKSKEEVEQTIIDYFGKDSSLGGVATLADLGLKTFPLNKTEKIVKRELEAPVAAYLDSIGGLS